MTSNTPSRYASVHEPSNRNGPGDARPTALQIIADEGISSLRGRTFVVTGCSSGLGIATAQALANSGARVYATARDMAKGEAALSNILEPGRVELVLMDMNSLGSVRAAAADILKRSAGNVNVLIANAGIMAVPEGKTDDDFETQFGVNHMAHFVLFQLLKPALLRTAAKESIGGGSGSSRVVMVASGGHKMGTVQFDDLGFEKSGYDKTRAYGQSKTANIWMANEIERRYGRMGLHATSLNPGGIKTGLQWNSKEIQEQMAKPEIIKLMKSPEQGAATTIWAAVSKQWESQGGKYLEDCSLAPVSNPQGGYSAWAYDEEGAKRLWAVSLDLAGMDEDGRDKGASRV